MAQATLSARIDKDDKIKFDKFCNDVGLNASSAINMFVKTVLRTNRIPFEIEREEDPFYSESNIKMLESRLRDMNNGVHMVEHDIIEDDQ